MRFPKNLLAALLIASLTLFSGNLSAQMAEVRIVVTPEPGSGMFSDLALGLDAATPVGTTLRFVCQIRSGLIIDGINTPLLLYSPDNSITTGASIENVQVIGQWASHEMWSGGSGVSITGIDGSLPDMILAHGTSITSGEPNTGGGGFQNSNFISFFEWTVTFDSTGMFCTDTSLFPPAAEWIVSHKNGEIVIPLWSGGGGDLSVGGTRTEAYCINVLERNCCNTPGDVNHDGMVNIADASYLVSRIFANGAPPACCREADTNGDGRMNIADITYMVRRIFAGGPAPICGEPVDNC